MIMRASFLPLCLSLLIGGSLLFGQEPLMEQKTVLPVGKPETGGQLFVEKACYQCHSAGATKLPPVDLAPLLIIELGGELHAQWTRDDYARAIMNPNHIVSEDYRVAMMRLGDNLKAENSPMPEFTTLLRVSELIDIAAFLDTLTE
jgi:mono/diheme cytochrome c family protein